jgi:hypothetical protein
MQVCVYTYSYMPLIVVECVVSVKCTQNALNYKYVLISNYLCYFIAFITIICTLLYITFIVYMYTNYYGIGIGITPRQITTVLRNMTTTPFTTQDVRNIIKDFQRNDQGGLAPNEALLKDLTSRNIYHQATFDDQNRITALFIAHEESLALAKINQDVVLLDCTYKTNKFKMPLFHIVGTSKL